MAVAFRSQTAVAYKSTATIEWYGDVIIGFIKQYFVNAIDFSFEIDTTDFVQVANKLSKEFESILAKFNFIIKAIDFANEVKIIDYTQDANPIDTSQEIQ